MLKSDGIIVFIFRYKPILETSSNTNKIQVRMGRVFRKCRLYSMNIITEIPESIKMDSDKVEACHGCKNCNNCSIRLWAVFLLLLLTIIILKYMKIILIQKKVRICDCCDCRPDNCGKFNQCQCRNRKEQTKLKITTISDVNCSASKSENISDCSSISEKTVIRKNSKKNISCHRMKKKKKPIQRKKSI